MFKINFQVLINIKNFKLMSHRQSSFLQLRLNVFNNSITKKKSEQAIPYLILTPQKLQSNMSEGNSDERKNSFDRKYSVQVQSSSKNISQIDTETNSFLTKTFLLRQIDHYIPINEIVVFKGSFQVTADDILESLSKESNSKKLLNKLSITCELFVVSSFSVQSIGEWYGYSLADEGAAALPIGFFSYNSACSHAQITFLWTSIEVINQNALKTIKEGEIKKIDQFFNKKIKKNQNQILIIPKQFSSKVKTNLEQNKNKASLEGLLGTIKYYNQKIYSLWKKYQQFKQFSIEAFKGRLQDRQSLFQQNFKKYLRALVLYHWKNNIIVTEQNIIQKKDQQESEIVDNQEKLKQTLYLEQKKNRKMPYELVKLKKDSKIDQNLCFYPYQQHERMIKLTNDDFKKIASISSLNTNNMKDNQSESIEKVQLVIFVHGYQASAYDMQNLANFLKYKSSHKVKTLLSTCNQGRTQQPIQESAHRLALQIKNYINNKFQFQNFEISFVCHSMGGLIVRAALKYLQLYKNKFKTFLSLCSPHLGLLHHTSALIKTSLWVLNQVKKDPSMIELTLQDNPQLEKTFLYELSKRSQLSWFKYPVFVGSKQDEYAPIWSALVWDKDFFFDTKQAKLYKMLFSNMEQKIKQKIIRLQAIYKDKINDISSFVGRTAHIRILNCIQVMEMMYLLIQKAF